MVYVCSGVYSTEILSQSESSPQSKQNLQNSKTHPHQQHITPQASVSTCSLSAPPFPVNLPLILLARFFSPSFDHFPVRTGWYCITPRWRICSWCVFSSLISFCSFLLSWSLCCSVLVRSAMAAWPSTRSYASYRLWERREARGEEDSDAEVCEELRTASRHAFPD